MQKLIDIHTHILPGVDDGARDMTVALEMLKLEEEQGAETVILTPHYVTGRRYTQEQLEERFAELQDKAKEAGIGTGMTLWNECLYSRSLADALDKGEARTLKGSIALVEFYPTESGEKIINGCRSLYNSGYRIVLAHIERYEAFDERLAYSLKEMDVEFQMNANYAKKACTSFPFGRKHWFKQLLKSGEVSYIASDAHDTEKRDPAMYADAIKTHIPEHADAMLFNNALKLL